MDFQDSLQNVICIKVKKSVSVADYFELHEAAVYGNHFQL